MSTIVFVLLVFGIGACATIGDILFHSDIKKHIVLDFIAMIFALSSPTVCLLSAMMGTGQQPFWLNISCSIVLLLVGSAMFFWKNKLFGAMVLIYSIILVCMSFVTPYLK